MTYMYVESVFLILLLTFAALFFFYFAAFRHLWTTDTGLTHSFPDVDTATQKNGTLYGILLYTTNEKEKEKEKDSRRMMKQRPFLHTPAFPARDLYLYIYCIHSSRIPPSCMLLWRLLELSADRPVCSTASRTPITGTALILSSGSTRSRSFLGQWDCLRERGPGEEA
jgi:hypothetical protein